ncbi:MAG: HDOD domain-containing protein [Gemmatimonadales bacterium]|nr:HDOD domain-containing protein [Gemmatimonadales bacterium]
MTSVGTISENSVSQELEIFIREAEDIPTIPESLIQIMRVLDDPDSGPSDLAEVVRLDSPLMSKILRLANSPYYNQKGNLSDINRCVGVLGYRTVRQMAISVSVATSLVSAVASSGGSLDYRELWRHSVVTGAMAKELAIVTGYSDPEEVFMVGLLHDIGKFILEIHDPVRYDGLIASRSQNGRSLIEMEHEEFGFDHAAIAGAFAKVWFLPELFAFTLSAHHETTPEKTIRGSREHALALLQLADYLANTMSPVNSDLGFDPRLFDPVALNHAAGISIADLEGCLDCLRNSVDSASAYLSLEQ